MTNKKTEAKMLGMEFEYTCGEIRIGFTAIGSESVGLLPRTIYTIKVTHGDRVVLDGDDYICPAIWNSDMIAKDLCEWTYHTDDTLFDVMKVLDNVDDFDLPFNVKECM